MSCTSHTNAGSKSSLAYRFLYRIGIHLPASHKKSSLASLICRQVSTSWREFLHLLARFLPLGSIGMKVRPLFHKARGVKIGSNVFIGQDVYIDDAYPEQICIEDNSFITSRCILLAHKRDLREFYKGKWIGDCRMLVKPVKIGKGAHIGMGSIIMPGVTVGEGAVVGAGSVVTTDVPDFTIAVGVPARVVKTVPE